MRNFFDSEKQRGRERHVVSLSYESKYLSRVKRQKGRNFNSKFNSILFRFNTWIGIMEHFVARKLCLF